MEEHTYLVHSNKPLLFCHQQPGWSSGMILALGGLAYKNARGPVFEPRFGPVLFFFLFFPPIFFRMCLFDLN